jgi:mannose/cellobiose epimerase-like protein (N-acyl-D-glucosamine 2-epimerase family)
MKAKQELAGIMVPLVTPFDQNGDLAPEMDDLQNLYRPWGIQPDHQTEWAKLLLTLHQVRPEKWMLERATDLFDRALEIACKAQIVID